MKLTKGALTMLLAQYRAIYKNAFIKGLASAALATAVLASGSASANPAEATPDGIDTTTGITNKVDASFDAANADDFIKNFPNLTIANGHTLDFKSSSSGTFKNTDVKTLNSYGSLKISVDTSFDGLNLNTKDFNLSEVAQNAKLTIEGGKTLTFKNSNVDLTSFSQIESSTADDGKLTLSGTTTAVVNEDQLTNDTTGFFKATQKGQVILADTSTLEIKAKDAENGLNLTADLVGTAAAGKISGSGTIKSDKVTVGANITGASTISVEANDLTVGADSAASIATGLKDAKVHKSLNILGNDADATSVKDLFILDGDFSDTNLVTSNKDTIKLDTASKGLTVQKGKWTIDKNLEVASGSLTIGGDVANKDGSDTASLSLADGKILTLTSGIVNVKNTTFNLTKDGVLGTVATAAEFNVDSGATVNITSANLTSTGKLITGKIKLDNGGILNITDDLTIGADKLVSGADSGKIAVVNGTLQGKGITLEGSGSTDVSLTLKETSNLEFDSFNFVNKGNDNKTTLAKGVFTSHGDITVAKDGTNGALAVEGANPNDVTLNLHGTGTVNATEVSLKNAKVDVDGAWTIAGKLSTKEAVSTLGMAAGSSLIVNQLNVGKALTVGGGDLTIVGTDATGDIALSEDLTIGAGSTLTIGKLAIDDILSKNADDTNNIKVNINKNFAADKLKSESSTATLKLELNNTYSLSKDVLNEFKKSLQGFTGFINFGDAKFDGTYTPNKDGSYNYSDVKNYAESKFTTNALENAVINTKKSDGSVMGSFGSLHLDDAKEQTLGGPTVLNKADGSNHFITTKDGAVGDVNLEKGAELALKNGGEIGKVTLVDKSSLLVASGTGKTIIGDIAGATAKAEFGTGLVSTGAINVQDTKFTAGANADIKSLTTKSLNIADSSVKVAEKVELTNSEVANIANSTLTAKDFNLTGTVETGKVDKNKVVQIADLALSKGGSLIVDGKLTSTEGEIAVGFAQHSDIKEAQPEATYASMFVKDASAFTGSVSVESGEEGKSSIAVFGAKAATETLQETRSLLGARATTSVNQVAVNFDADAGKNGVLAFGYDSKDAANKVLVDNGLLTSANGALGRNLESIALVNSQVVLADKKGIELNGGTTTAKEDVQLGQKSAIVLTNEAFNNQDKTAIKLAKVDGTVGFDKLADADKSKEAKILLAGKFTVSDVKDKKVFGSANGGTVTGIDGLQVETVNGLLKGKLAADGSIANYGLADNYRGILYQASTPVAKYIGEYLSGTVASTINEKSTEAQKAQANFFDTLITTTKGLDVEQAARYAVYGGTVKAAELASKAGSEAILAYVQGANTVATAGTANGSIFVVPTYKSSESDSFGAEGVEYGTDIKLKGVSLGADFAINPNFKLGAMFNIGTGDADGKSIASGIESDVDYVGGGLFATFTNGALRVVSDITYTDISSDVKSSIGINNYTADSDASVLSLGVNGEYKFDLDGSYVTPHAGVRYSKYDIDDVTVKANGKDFVKGSYDSMSVVSIPFGVTVGTDMLAGDWMLQPSLDLGVTFNIGDTDVNHSAIAFGAADGVGLTSEILDDVVFGIKGGLKASYNNLSIGLGLGYEVGSNADDLSVQASGVYTF